MLRYYIFNESAVFVLSFPLDFLSYEDAHFKNWIFYRTMYLTFV